MIRDKEQYQTWNGFARLINHFYSLYKTKSIYFWPCLITISESHDRKYWRRDKVRVTNSHWNISLNVGEDGKYQKEEGSKSDNDIIYILLYSAHIFAHEGGISNSINISNVLFVSC